MYFVVYVVVGVTYDQEEYFVVCVAGVAYNMARKCILLFVSVVGVTYDQGVYFVVSVA